MNYSVYVAEKGFTNMNERGRRFIQNHQLNTAAIYGAAFSTREEKGDMFQQACIERYKDYNDGTCSYDDFYRAVRMRVFNTLGKQKGYCSPNLYFSEEELKTALMILDEMYPRYKWN